MPDDHLSHLLLAENSRPFYKSIAQSLKELVRPAKLPPLDVTSQPVPVKDIWGLYGRQKRSFLMSGVVQVTAVVLIFTALSSKTVQKRLQHVVPLFVPAEVHIPKPAMHSGGGGGGNRSPLPTNKGKLPKPAVRQFVPPSAVVNNPQPKLVMDASILAPPDSVMPNVNLANFGDPLDKIGPASNGPGSGGGIGSGKGGGVGPGDGGGVGPGSGFGAYTPGRGGVTYPKVLHEEEPEYADEARRARFQGQVVVYVEIDPTGKVIHPHIMQSVGLGLDEKALECAVKWKFKPGTLDGKPVTTKAAIYMSFHLL